MGTRASLTDIGSWKRVGGNSECSKTTLIQIAPLPQLPWPLAWVIRKEIFNQQSKINK